MAGAKLLGGVHGAGKVPFLCRSTAELSLVVSMAGEKSLSFAGALQSKAAFPIAERKMLWSALT